MTDTRHRPCREPVLAVVLLAVAILLFFVRLGSASLWGSSEARSAQIAAEMCQTGDYVVPRLNGLVSLTKPPLYHWLAALSYHVFGTSETAARLPSAVAAVLTVLATWFLARRLAGAQAGFMAALMTASSVDFAWNARLARTDMVYTFFAVAAITAFVYALDSARPRKSVSVLAFALMGLAFLAKGPAGLFLPLAAVLGGLWLAGRRTDVKRVPWLLGALVFLAVALPWHVAACASVSAAQRGYFLWGQMARWFAGSGESSLGNVLVSPLLYVLYVLKGFFPWSFLLPAALWHFRRAIVQRRDIGLSISVAWSAAGLVAFCFSLTTASRYLVPMFPAAAIIVASFWCKAGSCDATAPQPPNGRYRAGINRSIFALAVACILVAAVAIAGPVLFETAAGAGLIARLNDADAFAVRTWIALSGQHWWLRWTPAAMVVLVLAAGRAVTRAAMARAFAFLAVAAAGALCVFQFLVLPELDRAFNVRPFVRQLDAVSSAAPYGWVGNASLETLFYMGRPFDQVKPANIGAYLQSDSQAVVLLWSKDLPRMPLELANRAKVIMRARLKHGEVAVLASPENPNPAIAQLPRADALRSLSE